MTQAHRVEVDGLAETITALGRVDRELAAEARAELRNAAKTVKVTAQTRLTTRPGGGTYPRRRGMIGHRASGKGAAVLLRGDKHPWAWGAEFGAKRAWVWGQVTTQGRLRKRQFPVWRGNQFVVRGVSGPGWIIQPTIRRLLPRLEEEVADGISAIYRKALDRAGVPRG